MEKKKNYRELGQKELVKLKEEFKQKNRESRFEKIIGSNFKSSDYRKAKREIARINTILTEMEGK